MLIEKQKFKSKTESFQKTYFSIKHTISIYEKWNIRTAFGFIGTFI